MVKLEVTGSLRTTVMKRKFGFYMHGNYYRNGVGGAEAGI